MSQLRADAIVHHPNLIVAIYADNECLEIDGDVIRHRPGPFTSTDDV